MAFAVKMLKFPGAFGPKALEGGMSVGQGGGGVPKMPGLLPVATASFRKRSLGNSKMIDCIVKCTTLILRKIIIHEDYKIISTIVIYQC